MKSQRKIFTHTSTFRKIQTQTSVHKSESLQRDPRILVKSTGSGIRLPGVKSQFTVYQRVTLGVGKDSWESLGLQRDPTSPS